MVICLRIVAFPLVSGPMHLMVRHQMTQSSKVYFWIRTYPANMASRRFLLHKSFPGIADKSSFEAPFGEDLSFKQVDLCEVLIVQQK